MLVKNPLKLMWLRLRMWLFGERVFFSCIIDTPDDVPLGRTREFMEKLGTYQAPVNMSSEKAASLMVYRMRNIGFPDGTKITVNEVELTV